MGDDFDDFVVEVKQGNENKHDAHVDEESEDAAEEEFGKFTDEVFVFDAKDEGAVGEIGESNGNNPGNDVGGLEFEGVFGVEDGEDEDVVSDEADDGGHDANDEVANDLGVLGVFGFEEFS